MNGNNTGQDCQEWNLIPLQVLYHKKNVPPEGT